MSWAPVARRFVPHEPRNAESVLSGQALDLLATAPQGVAKLRDLIRMLAVQGKLAPQSPTDKPVSELLERIRKSRRQLVDKKRSAGAKTSAPDPDRPFALPINWEWVRIGDVFSIEYGSSLPASVRQHGSVPVYGSNGIVGFHNSALVSEPSLVIGRKGSVGAVNVAVEPFWPIDTSYFVTPPKGIHLNYAELVFRWLNLGQHDKATAIPGINRNDVCRQTFGLPPLSEQARIVARVEELMQLCDALESQGRLQDEQHVRLVATLLDALAASESAHALSENWQRVATHFDLLLDRTEAVDALEQTILQLAVRGLLVRQDFSEEAADELLQRVSRQHQGSGKSKRSVASAKGTNASIPPYELPKQWLWAPLCELVENMGSGWSPACEDGERSSEDRWAVLRTTAVQVMEFRPQEHKAIPQKLVGRPEICVREGDILITRAGPMNRVGISCWVDRAPPRLMLSDKIVRFQIINDEMVPAFVVLALNAGWTKDQIEDAKTGMAASQVNISQAVLQRVQIPVCSKAEQHRIVARVEQLRGLCADLRERLQQARATQSRLADALVNTAAKHAGAASVDVAH